MNIYNQYRDAESKLIYWRLVLFLLAFNLYSITSVFMFDKKNMMNVITAQASAACLTGYVNEKLS